MQINNFQNLPISTSAYEQKVIDFCQKWFGGQAEFTIKTSGSTGEPKLITLSRRQMIASAILTGRTFGLKRGDRALVCLNVDYIAGMMMLVRGMELELKLTIVKPSGNPFIHIQNQPFDFLAFVPLQLQNLLNIQQNLETLNQAKAIIVGGAAVNEALEIQIQEIESPVYGTYGMTETVSHIAVKRLNGIHKSQNFQVLAGVKIGIDDRKCLNITAEASNNELVQTNDIVEMINPTEFKLLGRFDNIINSGGVKIQLEKIEHFLANQIKILNPLRFFAYGLPDDTLGQKLVLCIEGEEVSTETRMKFLANIQAVLPKYEIPKEIYFVPQFIETPTGKVDKKKTLAQVRGL